MLRRNLHLMNSKKANRWSDNKRRFTGPGFLAAVGCVRSIFFAQLRPFPNHNHDLFLINCRLSAYVLPCVVSIVSVDE